MSVDAEALVNWVYQRQKAHIIAGLGIGLYDQEAAASGIIRIKRVSLSRFEMIQILGCQIDGGGPDAGRLHEDAEAVHDFIDRMPAAVRGIVILHALAGTRPSWDEGLAPKWGPVWKGAPRYDRDGRPARGSYKVDLVQKVPVACRVMLYTPPSYIDGLRRDYAAWHGALAAIARKFGAGTLKRYDVTPPAAPAAPWISADSDQHVVAAKS